MNSELLEFSEVTGLTLDEVKTLGRDNPNADKLLASLGWLDEITTHESVLMRIDAVKDEIESGERLPARQLQETLQHLESVLQSRVKSIASHTTAVHPPARGFIDDAAWNLERYMFDDLAEGLHGPVLDHVMQSWSTAIADSEGLEPEEAHAQLDQARAAGQHAEAIHTLKPDDMTLAEMVSALAIHLEGKMNRSN